MAFHIDASCDFFSGPNLNVRGDDVEQTPHAFKVAEPLLKLCHIYLLHQRMKSHRQTFVCQVIWLIFDQVRPK